MHGNPQKTRPRAKADDFRSTVRNLRIDEVSARIGIAQSTVDKLVVEGLNFLRL